jgi:hypothetical protein
MPNLQKVYYFLLIGSISFITIFFKMFLLEAISKIEFWLKFPRETQRDKKAGPSFNPPRLLTGSSTRILKYVEELKRGPTQRLVRLWRVGTKGFFEIASILIMVD